MKPVVRLDPSTGGIACLRKIQLYNIQGWVPKISKPWLDFGKALHIGIAHYRRGGNPTECVSIAQQHYAQCMCDKKPPRTLQNLKVVLNDYMQSWIAESVKPLEVKTSDGTMKHAVELPFSMPLLSTEHVDVLLCGVIDCVGTYEGQGGKRILVINDIKHSTSTSPKAHMESFLSSPQFMVYSYALRHTGLIDYYVPVVIDGIYLKKDVPGAICHQSAPIDYSDYMIDRCIAHFRNLAETIARFFDPASPYFTEWPHNFSQCDIGWEESCEFKAICQCPAMFQNGTLESIFNKREYNPREF